MSATAATTARSFAEEADGAVDVRGFGDLQARLRAMSYLEPVTIESAPLVRHVLADLVRASEAKEAVERALEKAQREALELSQVILPLRKENASLTRENNSLHLEIIHQEEAIAERERACELQLQGLQDDIKRLQFLNSQKSHQCALKEQEVTKLQIQLERLMAMGADAFRTQRPLDASSIERRGSGGLPASPTSQPLRSPRKAERVQSEEQVSAIAQTHAAELSRENEQLRAQLESFHTKLAKREAEISRLAKLSLQSTGAGSSADDAARKVREQSQQLADLALQDASELQREQLQSQVDLLNDQVAKYEARLKDAHEQLRLQHSVAADLERASSLNDKYARELSALQAKYDALEAQRFERPAPAATEDLEASRSSSASASRPQPDVASLEAQVASLAAHRDRLEDALRATHYDKISYTNALANANAHNRVLANDLARADAKSQELSTSLTKAQQALADATAQTEALTRDVDVLTESLKQSEDACAVEREKNASLHRELRAMDAVIAQRDDECRALNYSLLTQKSEVERLTSKLEALSSAGAAAAATETKGSDPKTQQEIQWLEDERQALRRGKEELLVQVMNLEDALQTAQSARQRSELEVDTLTQQLAAATQRHASLERALDDKKRERLELERTLATTQTQVRELQTRLQQTNVLLERADATEDAKIAVESEALGLRKRVEELRDEAASLQLRLESSDAHARRLSDQAARVQSDLALAQQTASVREREVAELTKRYDSVVSELRSARQSAQHYQSEYEKLAQELQSQHQERSSDQSALETSASAVRELRGRVAALESDVSLKTRALQQLQTRLEQEKLSRSSAQSDLALARDELQQVRETSRARDATVQQLRDALEAKDRELTDKSAAVENFRLLVEQMEASREQVLFKVKTQQQQLTAQALGAENAAEKLRALEQELQTRANEVASLKALTRTLDAERDSLTDQLDALTEKVHEASEQNAALRAGAQTESSAVRDLEAQVASLVNDLNDRDARVEALETRCTELAADVDRLEHVKGVHAAELAALSQDLENMTIENQALSEECARAQFAHASQSQSSSSLQHAVRAAERERDALSVELEDLRHTYRSLVHEHDGLARARAQVAELHEELAVVNDALRKQVAALESERDGARATSATLTTEVATYREQVSFLTEKLHASEQALSEREDRQHDLEHALETQRQVATEISAQRYGAQAQSAAVSQRIVHLEAKLSHAKLEARALRDRVETEATQRRSLEALVASLREKVAANDTLIAHLEEQRQAMAHEIQTRHQRRVAAHSAMDVAELSHTGATAHRRASLSHSSSSRSSSSGASPRRRHDAAVGASPLSTSRSKSPSETPQSERGLGNSVTSSALVSPLRSLEEAQRKCQELEDRLTQQDDTIKHLERSRSKFKRFAVKYEREIEQRDRLITELRSSQASSFVSPDARLGHSTRSSAPSSSSSSTPAAAAAVEGATPRRSRPGAHAVSS